MIKPAFKCTEWKKYTYPIILNNFPQNYQELTYIEVCVGSGSLYLNKKPSTEEIINDIDPTIISIWKSLRDRGEEFIDAVCKYKASDDNFKELQQSINPDLLSNAIKEFLLRKMSKNEAKQEYAKKTTKIDKENLVSISDRLKDTIILKENILEIIKLWDSPNVFMYIDPPVLPAVRVQEHLGLDIEMSTEEHVDFMHRIKETKAKVLVSGYSSNLYNKHLKNWKVIKTGNVVDKKIECLWCNY